MYVVARGASFCRFSGVCSFAFCNLLKDVRANLRASVQSIVFVVVFSPGFYRTPAVTRQSLNVDQSGPAISNLLHPYLLLPRTDGARVTKTENGHKTGRQGTDFD